MNTVYFAIISNNKVIFRDSVVFSFGELQLMGSMGGSVARALASHQCGPGSIPGPGVICGFTLLLVLPLLREVFLRVLRFSPLLKNQHC